jgi:hypothetical protein
MVPGEGTRSRNTLYDAQRFAWHATGDPEDTSGVGEKLSYESSIRGELELGNLTRGVERS